jgi:protein SCO1/2
MSRRFARLFAVLSPLMVFALTSCGLPSQAKMTDISGVMPDLSFHMTRVNDGVAVSADSYRGKAVILYFGYTHCPDECPTTLANLATVLKRLGPAADKVCVLFVSVDPGRDTVPILKSYVEAFAPQIDGLRGSDDAVAALARRYRVIYSVMPESPGHSYAVMHSASVFFFDGRGRARFVTMSTDDVSAVADLIIFLDAGR